MTREGTVVNGVIVPDGPPPPEGVRVRFEVEDDIDPPAGEPFEYPHPLASYDREKELAVLRERVGQVKAGVPGVPLQEAMDRIAATLNLPAVDPESA
jgi:hypothetical protein